jgi:hypothetical protein
MAVVGLPRKPVVAAGMAEVVIGTAVAGMALVQAGTAAATGTEVAGITVVTAAVGELAPRSVSVLALDCLGERWQRLLITAATTMGTITRLIPVHPHLRFGIGAMPTRAIILRYRNVLFRGSKLLSKS